MLLHDKIPLIESNGMLCSQRELGLEPDHEGILDLTKNTKAIVGDPLTFDVLS